MTASDMPLADATVPARSHRARVSARARAMVATTLGDSKIGKVWVSVRSTVVSDLRRWWLYTSRPPSLRVWIRAQRVAAVKVPGDSALLRRAWAADNWSTGVLFQALASLLLLCGAGLSWLALSPARRWVALLLVAACSVVFLAT